MSRYVSSFYNKDPEKEWLRLEHPYTAFEFVTTCDLISRFFPENGKVCDVGCGPGRYAMELLKRGYDVSLVDLSEELLKIAEGKIKDQQLPSPAQVLCANACDLSSLSSETFDAALHLGPMYHLIQKQDRQKTLSEFWRILKPGGIGIVAYLNSWGILRYGLNRFPEKYSDPSFVRGMLGEMAIPESFENFTECFWSTPPKAKGELIDCGFEILTYIGCEGFASGLKKKISEIAEQHPKAYETILQVIRESCEEEQFRSTSEHLCFVVKKSV